MAPRNRSPSPLADNASRRSDSPPAQQAQTKREKRRATVQDRLQEIVDSFNQNLRPHYEAQANAIQVDISLVLRSDPFQNRPLDYSPVVVEELIWGVGGDKFPRDSIAHGDFRSQAGKLYHEYVRKVNDAMEERDINLNLLHMKHRRTIDQLHQRHRFQVQLAKEEHKILSETLRERLVSTLNKRRERLLKEKEQLDIGDSNALLLHPNQFSLINPSSPGGVHKRHTRGRGVKNGAEAEEPGIGEKRKRKFVEEIEHPSPALGPIRDNGHNTPFLNNRAKNVYTQHEAPAFSIERLFTEKELQLNMNRAAVAASDFLVRLKNQQSGEANAKGTETNGEAQNDNGETSDSRTQENAGDGNATPLEAPGMERTQSHHQTRGATRTSKEEMAGLIGSASADFPLRLTLPTYIPAVIGAKANNAPVTVATLPHSEVEQDLMLMGRQTDGDDEYNNSLLERAKEPLSSVEYKYGPPKDAVEGHVEPLPLPLPAGVALGSVAMAKSASAAGHEHAMSRTASTRGLKRTASSTNIGDVGGKRARARA